MIKSSALRVAVGAEGVSIWSPEIFGDPRAARVREFLSRAFSVSEVEGVELRRAAAFGRIRYASARDPGQIWKKLGRALSGPATALDAELLYLDGPEARPVRVSRIGDSLSTWRVRRQTDTTLRLSHPILRNRRDIVFRLEEELAAILGVEDFRASALSGGVSIRFDSRALTPERIARELEKAWPRLLDGLDGPPSRTRLVAAVGLAGLSFAGQYVVPPLRPVAVAGVALYSLPNVINAAKQLARGQVGLPALYTAGLGLMLTSGMPFPASAMAVFTQAWPRLAHRKIVRTQRRLFAAARRRPVSVRTLGPEGVELEVGVDDLRPGDVIAVRSGEIIAVDGVVEDGFAALAVDALFGGERIEDVSQGDAVAAGAIVRDGSLRIRVQRAGAQTAASHVAALLPHGAIAGMPSSQEAERIANRNAKPALALSAASLLLTRSLRPSQVLIRPDYATAPRLSAQLSAFHAVALGVRRGVLFRRPAALDRVAATETFVIDDTAGLDRRRVEVSLVQSVEGISSELVLGYAAAAFRNSQHEQHVALAHAAAKRNTRLPAAETISRHAGVSRYRDSRGSEIELATARYLAASEVRIPKRLQTVPVESEGASLRALWVLRDHEVIGVIRFARNGELVAKPIVELLLAQSERARVLYLARGPDAQVQALARRLDIPVAHAGLTRDAKLDLIRGLGGKTTWIGAGSAPEARELIAASMVSISVAPLAHAAEDVADIWLPQVALAGLPAVLELGRAHARRLVRDYRTLYAANLLGASGAFVRRFSGLHAGLLSNAGTGLVYARQAWELDRLAGSVDRKRVRLRKALPA